MRRRSLPALIVLTAVAGAALTGCSTSSSEASCTVKSGNGSNAIQATGAFGTDPKATVPSPLHVAKTQSSVLIKGHGEKVEAGSAAELSVTLYSATDGEAAAQTQTGYFPIVSSQLTAGLAKALKCATVGSRIAVVVSPKDGASSLGAASDDASAVAVIDVKSVMPSRATGHARAATPGYPTVILATNGQPGIVIGSQKAPTKLSSAILKKGDGRTVTKKDTLIVQTQTVTWSDPTTATGTWEQGSPASQTLSDGSALSSQLIGARVGSQVEVLIPKAKASDGEAAVTVVDILGVLPAS